MKTDCDKQTNYIIKLIIVFLKYENSDLLTNTPYAVLSASRLPILWCKWFEQDLFYCRKYIIDGFIWRIVGFSHFLLISRLMSYP